MSRFRIEAGTSGRWLVSSAFSSHEAASRNLPFVHVQKADRLLERGLLEDLITGWWRVEAKLVVLRTHVERSPGGHARGPTSRSSWSDPRVPDRGHESARGCVASVFEFIQNDVVDGRSPSCPGGRRRFRARMGGIRHLSRAARQLRPPPTAGARIQQPSHRTRGYADTEQPGKQDSNQCSHRSSPLKLTRPCSGTDRAARRNSPSTSKADGLTSVPM